MKLRYSQELLTISKFHTALVQYLSHMVIMTNTVKIQQSVTVLRVDHMNVVSQFMTLVMLVMVQMKMEYFSQSQRVYKNETCSRDY